MKITLRQAKGEDAQQMLLIYNSFTKQFVGSASRTIKSFKTILRKKDNINWVALETKDKIIGYVNARLEKRLKRGEFREIVVHPKHDFEQVAKLLIEKVYTVFNEKKASQIVSSSVRNPAYEKVFPKLGFFEFQSTDVFMYAILDLQKFLNELSQVFINRLEQLQNWNGLTQIACEEHSLFLEKTNERVQQIVWTNQPIDFKIKLNATILTKLIFGIADSIECFRNGQLEVEPTLRQEQTAKLLEGLFPRKQFLIMDFW